MYKFTIKAGVFRESLLMSCVDFSKCSTFTIYAETRQEATDKIVRINGVAPSWYKYFFNVIAVEEV